MSFLCRCSSVAPGYGKRMICVMLTLAVLPQSVRLVRMQEAEDRALAPDEVISQRCHNFAKTEGFRVTGDVESANSKFPWKDEQQQLCIALIKCSERRVDSDKRAVKWDEYIAKHKPEQLALYAKRDISGGDFQAVQYLRSTWQQLPLANNGKPLTYRVTAPEDLGISIRVGPDMQYERTGTVLASGTPFEVAEVVEDDGQTYLRLAGGLVSAPPRWAYTHKNGAPFAEPTEAIEATEDGPSFESLTKVVTILRDYIWLPGSLAKLRYLADSWPVQLLIRKATEYWGLWFMPTERQYWDKSPQASKCCWYYNEPDFTIEDALESLIEQSSYLTLQNTTLIADKATAERQADDILGVSADKGCSYFERPDPNPNHPGAHWREAVRRSYGGVGAMQVHYIKCRCQNKPLDVCRT
mmetsp:Transcript_5904/g.10019  ORF Transcript_5904/g.10019 Transcript_5904/m.10019 type:complete len:412 (-) Transcript_5904:39-1274(-)